MWQFLLPILGSLAYNMLFGGTGDQTVTQETTTETPPTGFKDPGLGLLSPLLLGQLTQNASRFSNFGVPKGGQMTPFLGGQNLQTLLDLLQKEYEGIAGDYGKDDETKTKRGTEEAGESPCKHTGYPGKAGRGKDNKWIMLEKCKEGHTVVFDTGGYPWCCKEESAEREPECTNDSQCPEGQKCVNGTCMKVR